MSTIDRVIVRFPGPQGSSTPDATSLVKGKLRLAHHLGGTADAPEVIGLDEKAIELTVTAVKTSNYTAAYNEVIPVNATSGNKNITLPSPVAGSGIIEVQKNDSSANTVTVVGTINGGTNAVLSVQYELISLIPTAAGDGYWVR